MLISIIRLFPLSYLSKLMMVWNDVVCNNKAENWRINPSMHDVEIALNHQTI